MVLPAVARLPLCMSMPRTFGSSPPVLPNGSMATWIMKMPSLMSLKVSSPRLNCRSSIKLLIGDSLDLNFDFPLDTPFFSSTKEDSSGSSPSESGSLPTPTHESGGIGPIASSAILRSSEELAPSVLGVPMEELVPTSLTPLQAQEWLHFDRKRSGQNPNGIGGGTTTIVPKPLHPLDPSDPWMTGSLNQNHMAGSTSMTGSSPNLLSDDDEPFVFGDPLSHEWFAEQ